MSWRWLTRAALLTLAAVAVWSMVTHWLAWRFGMGIWPVPQGTGWTYQLLSGFIPALAIVTIVAQAAAWWYSRTCHEKPSCLRWGKYAVAGGIGRKCHKHHPDFRDHPRQHHGAVLDRLHEEWKARQS